jgi:hypothetical protein
MPTYLGSQADEVTSFSNVADHCGRIQVRTLEGLTLAIKCPCLEMIHAALPYNLLVKTSHMTLFSHKRPRK